MRERSCISCRKKADKSQFIRIVRSSDNVIKPDVSQKACGRGAYICRNMDCIMTAQKKNSLSRALRTHTDNTIYEELKKVIDQ